MVRHPNVENISIRNLADETDGDGKDGICSTLSQLFSRKTGGLKSLKEIEVYTPKYADNLIEGIQRNFIDRSCVVTRCCKDSDYGARLAFPLPEP